jgi:protoporphyrinogen oxidase
MDYVVIGAGPAGLQLGYFLQQAGRDYVVLEAGPAAGTFYNTFPRHR